MNPDKQNGRPAKLLKAFGCSLSMKDWAEVSGFTTFCIRKRLKSGSSLEDALLYRGKQFPEGAWADR